MNNTLYSQIDRNKRNTFIIMFLFIVFVTSFVYLISSIFLEHDAIFFLTPIALMVSTLTSIGSYFFSDKIVLAQTGAKKATGEPFTEYINITNNLSIAAGIPAPDCYYIVDDAPNAFATGRGPKQGVVVVTTGLLKRLNRAELEGVIAHELAHIKNFDIRLMAVVTVLVGTVAIIADLFMRGSIFGGGRSDKKSGGGLLIIIGLLFLILSPIIAELIKLAISRNREYLADATGAYFTRYPKGLADALKKISSDENKLKVASTGNAHLFISDPIKRKAAGLFSTHPPINERIKRLSSM